MKHTAGGYWLEEAGAFEAAPALEGEVRADVIVIGGGYTGMWAAWHLKRLAPGMQVALLEGGLCAQGPSGRNGGFCNGVWHRLPGMRRHWGDAGALAVAEASRASIDGIESFCAERGLQAWFHRGGYLRVSTAPAQDGSWMDSVSACRELGAPGAAEPLSAEQVRTRCASPAFRAGALYPQTATVQPARLALGLRAALLEAGVHIYERSAVRRLRAGFGRVEAQTAAGVARGTCALIAIGGAAKSRRGPLRNALTITSSHIVLTEPVPDVLESVGWTGGEGIADCRTMVHYFRTTPDGRIAFGFGGGRIAPGGRLGGRAELDPEAVALAARRLREYFPGLAGRRLTHAWGGPIDVSPTHLPFIRPLPGPAFAAAGYTGSGVGPSHMVGRALASLALDRCDEHAALPFVDPEPQRVPPEPLHWVGGSAVRRAILGKEEAESAGRRPGRIDSALARLPELIGFHIGR